MLQEPFIHYTTIVILLCVVAFLYLKIAQHLGIIDEPNERSSHSKPTIRGGGIVFFVGALLFFLTHDFEYPYFVLGLSIIAVLSFIDDLYTLGSTIRLVFQFVAIGLLLFEAGLMQIDYWILFVLSIICVGFMNIYNFMDGINGITGLYSLSILLGLIYLNHGKQVVPDDFLVYLILSVLVFGYFNFRKKALFFAGDIGSISIAICLIFLVLLFTLKIGAPVILLLFVVYMVDGGFTIVKRAFRGDNIFKPHREHLYQKLVHQAKLPHLTVALAYAIVQGLFIIVIALTLNEALWVQFLIIAVSLLVLGIFYVLACRKISSIFSIS